MPRLVVRAAVPPLVALSVMTFGVTRPVEAQSTTTTAPAPTTTTTTTRGSTTTEGPTSTTTVVAGSTTTTTAPPDGGLPSDDIGPTTTPPANLPPPQLSPSGADGGGTAVDPADATPLTPSADANLPAPGAIPRGLAAGLVATRGTERRLSAAVASYQAAERQLGSAQAALTAAQSALTQAGADLDAVSGPQQAAASRASASKARVRRLAAAALTTDTDGETMIAIIDAKDPSSARARVTTLQSIGHEAARSASMYARESRDLDNRTKAAAGAKASASQAVDEATDLVTASQSVVDAAGVTLTEAQTAAGVGPQVVPGIPDRVLVAYIRAAQWSSLVDPGCHMTWWGLAAIGRVESGNASHAAVSANGDIVPRITGIPLDGTNGTALIPDSDHGALDGDTTYDRAVGPMQFIPGTWRTNGVDASGDGIADPNNIYDAAFAAARYLCAGAGGQRTDTEAGMDAAAFSYNHSAAYVSAVWNGSALYRAIAAAATATG